MNKGNGDRQLPPLILSYQLTANDYRKFLGHLQACGSPLARPRLLERLARSTAVAAPLALLLALLLNPGAEDRSSLFLVGLLFVLLVIPLLAYARILGQRYRPEAGGYTLARRNLRFADAGLVCDTALGFNRHRWKQLRGWEATGDAYYIYLDRMMAYIVPRRVVNDSQGVLLQQWLNQKVGKPPANVPPPASVGAEPASAREAALDEATSGIHATFSHNLLCGLHVLIWPLLRLRNPDQSDWLPVRDAAHILLMSIMAGGLLSFAQYLAVPGIAALSPWGLMTAATMIVAEMVLIVVIALAAGRRYLLGAFMTLSAAAAVWSVAVFAFWLWLRDLPLLEPFLGWCSNALFLFVWVGYTAWMVITRGLQIHPLRGLLHTAVAMTVLTWIWGEIHPSGMWYEKQDEGAWPEVDVEATYYRQPRLLSRALMSLAAQNPGETDLYFVGFANDGSEAVFSNETRFAQSLFDQQFGTRDRSVVLLNDYERLDQHLLANTPNLNAVLRGIGSRMDSEQDVLFMYLTSHGTEDAALSANLWPLGPNRLTAGGLKEALDQAGIRWRILIVVGCHTGSFIPVLADENSLIITAAAADRVSFGCGMGREFTYFGEALLQHGLKENSDLLKAFAMARDKVDEWEQAEGHEPSLPQLHVGDGIKEKLAELSPKDSAAEQQGPESNVTDLAVVPPPAEPKTPVDLQKN